MVAPQKKDGSASALVIVVIAIVSIVAPIALLMAWLFTEFRARDGQLARLLEEGPVPASHRAEYAQLTAEVSRARMQLNQTEASGARAGHTTRQNAYVDVRQKAAGEFNSLLEKGQHRLFQAELQLQSMLILMRERWSDIADRIAQREGCRLAVMMWSATFLVLFPLKPDWTPVEKSAAASLVALVTGAFILLVRKADVEQVLQNG
jgi:flagellar basal body-associated protein FliL